MTIEAAVSEVSFAGDGVTVVFEIPFPFDTSADLKVIRTSSAGVPEVLTSGFGVTGGSGSTGSLTMATAPASGETLTILDDPEQTQPTDYVSNDAFPADAHEAALDRVTRIAKRLNQRANAALHFADGDPARGLYAELPTVAARRGLFLRFADTAIAQIEVADLAASGTTLSQSVIAAFLNPQTAAEASAGVTPSNYAYPPGDLRRYGCVGNGSTDDAAGVLAAIKQAAAGGAAVVGQPGATYLCTSWSPYSATSAIAILGFGCTIKGPASTVNFLKSTANLRVEGVTFDRWASAIYNLAADSGSQTDVRILRNVFTNCTDVCISLQRPIENYWIDENRFLSNTGGYAIRVGTNTYADQDTWQKGQIHGNTFKSQSASGSTSCAAMLIYGRDGTITKNIIDGVQGDGGEGWGIYTKLRSGVIAFNELQNINSTSNGDVVGINIKGAPRSITSSGVQGFQVLCFGNHVKSVGVLGVKGAGIRAQTDDVSVYGNTVEEAGLAAYVTDDSNGYSDHSFDDNRARWATVTAGTFGMRVEGNGSRISVTRLKVYNAETGIFIAPNAGALNDVQIEDNILDVTGPNIALSVLANVTYLKVRRNTARRGSYGFQNNGGVGTLSNLELSDNDFVRATTKVSGSIPSDSVVRRNKGYLEGSATYDPPNLADGAGTTTTVSVPGLLLGDVVQATFSLDLQGITLSAWCSAADTASVRFQNESGGALDLASGTLKAWGERR